MKICPDLMNLLVEKASQSPSSYRISAIAFDHKGDILGHASNNCGNISIEKYRLLCKLGISRSGLGLHAERRLIQRYRDLIKTILICRIGRRGDILPIEPCKSCTKIANKYGIRIISICSSQA